VPDIFRQFRELNPEVEFSLRAITTADQVTDVGKPGPSTSDFFVCRLVSTRPSMLSPYIANGSYSWYLRPTNSQKGKGCA